MTLLYPVYTVYNLALVSPKDLIKKKILHPTFLEFHLLISHLHRIMFSGQVGRGFEFGVFFLDMLPTKVKEPSLLYYLPIVEDTNTFFSQRRRWPQTVSSCIWIFLTQAIIMAFGKVQVQIVYDVSVKVT